MFAHGSETREFIASSTAIEALLGPGVQTRAAHFYDLRDIRRAEPRQFTQSRRKRNNSLLPYLHSGDTVRKTTIHLR